MTEIQQYSQPPKGRRILLTGLSPIQRKLLAAAGLTGAGAILTFGIRHIMEQGLLDSADLEKGALPPACATPAPASAVAVYAPENVSSAVTDDMDFATAFKAAREDCGPGNFFEWHGRSFNTFLKSEFDALSTDQKEQFYAAVRESLPADQPVFEHTELAHKAGPSDDESAQEQRLPTDFDDIKTNGERIDLDMDGDGKVESVAIDDNRDGYVDRLLSDTNQDGSIDRYMFNADDNIGLEQVLTRGTKGVEVLAPDKNTVITMEELQPKTTLAPTSNPDNSLPEQPVREEYLAEKSGEEAPPPEPGLVKEDYVAIDPRDLLPGESIEEPDDLLDEPDANDSGHEHLPDMEYQVDPQL